MRLRNILPLLDDGGNYTEDTTWDEMNIDSLGVYQLALEAEVLHNISIVDDDIEHLRTLGEFADLVNKKVESK